MFALGICIIGCSVNKRAKKIIYKPTEHSKAYTIEIPEKSKMFFVIGNSYSYYFHNNNGCIFISNESGFWNEKLLNDKITINDSLSNYIQRAEYGSIPAIDTFYNQGCLNNRYWKEQRIYYKEPEFSRTDTVINESGETKIYGIVNQNAYQNLYVGYYNVSKKNLPLFDHYLSTLKLIENPDFKRDAIVIEFLKKDLKWNKKYDRKTKKYEKRKSKSETN